VFDRRRERVKFERAHEGNEGERKENMAT
jgi:hypothetical protein